MQRLKQLSIAVLAMLLELVLMLLKWAGRLATILFTLPFVIVGFLAFVIVWGLKTGWELADQWGKSQ